MTENERIDFLVDTLECSIEEAKDLMRYDEKVKSAKAKDKLEYDLTAEQEKVSKKMRNVPSHSKSTEKKGSPSYKWETKEKKVNVTKKDFIADLVQYLQTNDKVLNINVENAERLIAFSIGEKNYTLTLTEKRKKKGE